MMPGFERSPELLALMISDLIEGHSVLDFGCGDGYFARCFEPWAKEIWGIERDPTLKEIASKFIKIWNEPGFPPSVDTIYCYSSEGMDLEKLAQDSFSLRVITLDTELPGREAVEEREIKISARGTNIAADRNHIVRVYASNN